MSIPRRFLWKITLELDPSWGQRVHETTENARTQRARQNSAEIERAGRLFNMATTVGPAMGAPLSSFSAPMDPPPAPAAFISDSAFRWQFKKTTAPSTADLLPVDHPPPPMPATLLPPSPGLPGEKPSRRRAKADLGRGRQGGESSQGAPSGKKETTLRMSSLTDAASSGDVETVQMLLERGMVDVNELARGGASALSLAAAGGEAKIVKMLLTAGADPDSQGKINGQTPLIRAVHSNYSASIAISLMLLRAKVSDALLRLS